MKVSVIIANILTFLIGTAHITNSSNIHQQLQKICFIRQFYFRAEKVILFARNRLRALIVLIFAHDMQIQVAHALCKQGCRLISYTANIRLVTIAACYNCPLADLTQETDNYGSFFGYSLEMKIPVAKSFGFYQLAHNLYHVHVLCPQAC